MPITFDPNSPGKDKKVAWATFIRYRNPQFKIHSTRGPALNACLRQGGEFVLWEMVNGVWIDRVRWEEPYTPKVCYVCGKKDQNNINFTRWASGFKLAWINKKDPVPTLDWLCEDHYGCP